MHPTTGSANPNSRDSGFWSPQTLRSQLSQIVAPADERHIKQGAIELRMGCEAFVTGHGGRVSLPEKTGEVIIPPGQFALLLAEEKVTIPLEAIGFISIKFGLKARGLVNVSGFHVDPGFSGWLTFSVYNAGPGHVTISRGKEAFLLWLAYWDHPVEEPEKYSPSNNKGRGREPRLDDDLIMNLQGEIASPGALAARLDELQKGCAKLETGQQHLKWLFGSLVLAAVSWIVVLSVQSRSAPSGAPVINVTPAAQPPGKPDSPSPGVVAPTITFPPKAEPTHP